MNTYIQLLLLLSCASAGTVLNETIKDIQSSIECATLGNPNCARCYPQDNIYSAVLNYGALCYECIHGKESLYWKNGACTNVPEPREISGWGRSCAVCGSGNYWSTKDGTCKPCRYESAHCKQGFPCCDEERDFHCTDTFVLNPDTQKCECQKGEAFKVYNKCYCTGEENVYLEKDGSEFLCQKCKDKCNKGCENFECPKGTYLSGCECLPVHYSCASAPSASEWECEECATNFERVDYENGNHQCLCKCCSIEIDKKCVSAYPSYPPSLLPYSFVDGVCQCPMPLADGVCGDCSAVFSGPLDNVYFQNEIDGCICDETTVLIDNKQYCIETSNAACDLIKPGSKSTYDKTKSAWVCK